MKRILIVDDSQLILNITRSILEKEGYSVLEAHDGKECFKVVEKLKPDIILLDVVMPDMDGWEVCKKIKETKATRDIPVVMFTTQAREKDFKKSIEYAGAYAHILKPFNREELINLVKEAIKDKD
jgi:CheY-like chemotaxis protein